jgi:hypothetical protein
MMTVMGDGSLDGPRLRQDFEDRHRRRSDETGRVGGRIHAGVDFLLAPARPENRVLPSDEGNLPDIPAITHLAAVFRPLRRIASDAETPDRGPLRIALRESLQVGVIERASSLSLAPFPLDEGEGAVNGSSSTR